MIKDEAKSEKLSKQERRKQKVAARASKEASDDSAATSAPKSQEIVTDSASIEVKEVPSGDKLSKQERRKQKVALKAANANLEAQSKENIPVKQEILGDKPIQDKQSQDEKNEKSKSELRAERRAKQEQQRLAKENAKKAQDTLKKKPGGSPEKNSTKVDDKREALKKITDTAPKHNKIQLFRHLGTHRIGLQCLYQDIHPSIVKLGAQYASKTIIGSDARCLALLQALNQLIVDFQTPINQELCRAFETHLSNNVEHLHYCRPFAVSMTNALRHFKLNLAQLKTSTLTDSEKKERMKWLIVSYVEDEIQKAATAISQKVCEKITDNDVILTYGHSSLVNKILTDAKKEGKTFKVIVVDARPLLEGRQTLTKLVNAGIECTYVLITGVNFIIKQATKVLFGAHALLNNGYVMARAGTALVALIAKMHMKPVLVCCETSKFSERAQTDSFVYNEIGDPDAVMQINDKSGNLNALNLMYDVTPPKYITGIATELGILPCTSVPVILRLKPTELS